MANERPMEYLKMVVLACFIPASANQRSLFSVRHVKEAEDVGDYLRNRVQTCLMVLKWIIAHPNA